MVDSIAQNKCTREWNEDKAIKVSIKVSHTSMALNGNTIPLESCRHRSQTKQRHAKMNWHTHTQPRTNTHTHTIHAHIDQVNKWTNERWDKNQKLYVPRFQSKSHYFGAVISICCCFHLYGCVQPTIQLDRQRLRIFSCRNLNSAQRNV